jgi:hypothetical protein
MDESERVGNLIAGFQRRSPSCRAHLFLCISVRVSGNASPHSTTRQAAKSWGEQARVKIPPRRGAVIDELAAAAQSAAVTTKAGQLSSSRRDSCSRGAGHSSSGTKMAPLAECPLETLSRGGGGSADPQGRPVWPSSRRRCRLAPVESRAPWPNGVKRRFSPATRARRLKSSGRAAFSSVRRSLGRPDESTRMHVRLLARRSPKTRVIPRSRRCRPPHLEAGCVPARAPDSARIRVRHKQIDFVICMTHLRARRRELLSDGASSGRMSQRHFSRPL